MKHQLTLKVDFIQRLKLDVVHICLVPEDNHDLPEMLPGQFVEVAVDRANVLLNRPFSIFNYTPRRLELLVKPLGRASAALADYSVGDTLRVIAPLGRGFSQLSAGKVLLVGGGVGIAPLYYQARALNNVGIRPVVIYGERTAPDKLLCAAFEEVADLHICTDDGSAGFHGFVTEHPQLLSRDYDLMQVCGPMPMMRSLYAFASDNGVEAEFSLENKMACGLGACLCCVEDTAEGNRCVCTDGPVFRKEELKW